MTQFNLYLITCLLTGDLYVGKTTQSISERWSQHKWNVKQGDPHLYRAMRRHGVENFTVEPLVMLDDDFTDEHSLNEGERKMIRLLRVNCRLYNETDGGEGGSAGRIWSESTRRKLSVANRGKTRSDETRRKLSLVASSSLGRESRRRSGLANRGRIASEETRHKLSAARIGKHLAPEHVGKLRAVLNAHRSKQVTQTLESLRSKPYIRTAKYLGDRRYEVCFGCTKCGAEKQIIGDTRLLRRTGLCRSCVRLGTRLSEQTRKRLSESRRGKPTWNKGKIGVQTPWNKGRRGECK